MTQICARCGERHMRGNCPRKTHEGSNLENAPLVRDIQLDRPRSSRDWRKPAVELSVTGALKHAANHPKRLANVDNSRDRIARLRARIHNGEPARCVLLGILDLLEDQL